MSWGIPDSAVPRGEHDRSENTVENICGRLVPRGGTELQTQAGTVRRDALEGWAALLVPSDSTGVQDDIP